MDDSFAFVLEEYFTAISVMNGLKLLALFKLPTLFRGWGYFTVSKSERVKLLNVHGFFRTLSIDLFPWTYFLQVANYFLKNCVKRNPICKLWKSWMFCWPFSFSPLPSHHRHVMLICWIYKQIHCLFMSCFFMPHTIFSWVGCQMNILLLSSG